MGQRAGALQSAVSKFTCTSRPGGKSDQETESRAIAPLVVVPLPEPFHIQATVVAVSATQLRVEAVITPALLGNPHAEIWQGQATPLTSLNLTYDPGRGRYTGIVNVASTSELQGDLRVSATDTGGHTVVSLTSFRLEPVSRGAITLVSSSDGVMEVVIPQNGLSSETIVSIQRSTVGTAGQGNLVRASGAYQVTVSTGQTVLNGHAVLHMVYDPDLIPVKADTLHIHRWDEGGQAWIALGGDVDGEISRVSVGVNQLSVFAVLGEKEEVQQKLYLPAVIRSSR